MSIDEQIEKLQQLKKLAHKHGYALVPIQLSSEEKPLWLKDGWQPPGITPVMPKEWREATASAAVAEQPGCSCLSRDIETVEKWIESLHSGDEIPRRLMRRIDRLPPVVADEMFERAEMQCRPADQSL